MTRKDMTRKEKFERAHDLVQIIVNKHEAVKPLRLLSRIVSKILGQKIQAIVGTDGSINYFTINDFGEFTISKEDIADVIRVIENTTKL